MKIGFDIGGVLSKYPKEFRELLVHLSHAGSTWEGPELYVITDQHPLSQVIKVLEDNNIYMRECNVVCADYERYGNMAKAILIKELGLDIFIDDFDGYLQWDSSLGPQPILLKVMPDAYKPYWHDDWKCDGSEFGRRKYATEKN